MADTNINSQQNGAQSNTSENQQRQFGIQRLYVKDLSLEAPSSPKIFLKKWEPEMNIDLGTKAEPLEKDTYEVVLTVTITVKVKEDTAFLVEVKQAGIFSLQGFTEAEIRPMLGAFCPNILYPYARAVVTEMVMHAGFPQLYLTPVNFDALYEQHQQQQKPTESEDKKN